MRGTYEALLVVLEAECTTVEEGRVVSHECSQRLIGVGIGIVVVGGNEPHQVHDEAHGAE